MKKTQNIIALLCFFLFFVLLQSKLICQPNRADEIFNTFKRLENKYISIAKERLLYFLNEDSILKENFLTGDSAKYKNLKLIVRPILKFKKEAENYTLDQDIFSLIDFDTINYHSVTQFYFGDKLLFILTRGHNECDIGVYEMGSKPPKWCQGDFYFSQKFYHSNENTYCQWPVFLIVEDSSFIFFIDYLQEAFILTDNKIMINPKNYRSNLCSLLDQPNEFIKRNGYNTEEWIRHCARGCPDSGEKP